MLPPDKDKERLDLYNQGMSDAEIAKRVMLKRMLSSDGEHEEDYLQMHLKDFKKEINMGV